MRPLRVFLVENDPDTQKYIRLYLEHLGHEVKTAQNMVTALREFEGAGFDVLISDISLPDGDGWQLLAQLGSKRPARAIAMSGYGSEEDLLRSRSAGFDDHLVKPFLPSDLLALLPDTAAVSKTPSNDRRSDS